MINDHAASTKENPLRRREDARLLQGRGRFIANLHFDKMLHLALLRSPHAHARISNIHSDQARALTGVVAVFTGEEINPFLKAPLPVLLPPTTGEDEIQRSPHQYPLATKKVRYLGEPVVAVIAETPYVAHDALELITVKYDPLPAVMDPEQALATDTQLIYEEWDSNVALHWSKCGGDVEAAFAQADKIIELHLVNQRLVPNAMEPRAVVACHDAAADRITLWSTTQVPHAVKMSVAAALGMLPQQLRVIAPDVGGGFGAKANVYGEEVLVPFLAKTVGRPIRWVASRTEDYVATSHGRDQIHQIRMAANRDGKVSGIDAKIVVDCGAYHSRVLPVILHFTGQLMTGVYDIPNVRVTMDAAMTNKVSNMAYRGAGRPEAIYTIERAMDRLAVELDMDAVELRRRNLIPACKFPYTTAVGTQYDSGDYALTLERALALVHYGALREQQLERRRKGDKLLGIGVCCHVESSAPGPWETGAVAVAADGTVTVSTGTVSQGQGHETVWAQLVADILQINGERVVIIQGDTDQVERGFGTYGSRSAALGGSAIALNAQRVCTQAKKVAAHLLEVPVQDVVLTQGRFHVTGSNDRFVDWSEVAEASHSTHVPIELQGSLAADSEFAPVGETFPFGTQICVVEVEPDTGNVAVLEHVAVEDCGVLLNSTIVAGQVHGGIAQGISQALFEQAVYDNIGNLLSGSLMDYTLPRADTLPNFITEHTITPSPVNPLGVKGIGEAPTVGATPAVVNAVIDALSHLGVRHLDMPLTAEKIWRAIHCQQTDSTVD